MTRHPLSVPAAPVGSRFGVRHSWFGFRVPACPLWLERTAEPGTPNQNPEPRTPNRELTGRRLLRLAVTAGCLLALPPITLIAQSDGVNGTAAAPYEIRRVSSPIAIDGAITEDAWIDALQLPLDFEVRPGENVPPPVRTELFLAYDDARLLVAFRCYDSDPARIRARFSDRDRQWNDDWVGVVLDTFNDERRAYELFSNALGVQGDMLMDDVSGNEDDSWNAIFDSAGRLTEFGFEVEMGIPFSQLRLQDVDGVQVWGLDAIRSYPRRDRHHITLFPRIRGENSYLSQERKIVGFEGIRPGRNLEIVPTVTALRTDRRHDFPAGEIDDTDGRADLGLSVRWGVTPNVTLNGTLNPDFSQVEADAVQLDINNTFALFFPETRPFFLEGADFFAIPRMNLLHTRKIADPVDAAKLTGKIGRHTFGFFTAQDEVTTFTVPGSERSRTTVSDLDTTATVGRYRFDFGRNSTLGAMVTDRRGGGYANQVISLDMRHRLTPSDSVTVAVARAATHHGEAAADELDLPGGDKADTALDVHYGHSTRNWYTDVLFRRYGRDFQADLGFINQVDFHYWEYGAGRVWQGDSSRFFNRMQVGANVDQTEEQDGTLLEREAEVYVNYSGPHESFARWGGGVRDRTFAGVAFEQVFQSAGFEMRGSPDLYVGLGLDWRDHIDFVQIRDADEVTIRPFVNYNLGRHLYVRYSHTYNTLDVAGGRLFTAHVPEARIVYQHDARLLMRAILQYTDVRRRPDLYLRPTDATSRNFFTQLLFSYKVNAQTVVYVGYSDTYLGSSQYDLTQANRTFFTKAGYAWLR